MATETNPQPAATAPAGLGPGEERRNALVYAGLWSLIYLAAPVLYIGFVQAALCKRLGTSDTAANLPSSIYQFTQVFAIVFIWLFPQARLLRRIMALCFLAMGLAGAGVAAVLLAGGSAEAIVAALYLHAAILGAANALSFALIWEALDRGVSEKLRGRAFALAFGWGPGFAVTGSILAQWILYGGLFGWRAPPGLVLRYPANYAVLFGLSAVVMGGAAFLVRFFRIPLPARDAEREPFMTGVFGGAKSILTNRLLLLATIAYILVYAGNWIQNNISIYTQEAIGRRPEELVGYQLALRFSFKMAAGFFLGWLLNRTNPKVPLLATVGLQVAGVLWVLFVPGYAFLLAFGLNGAGELFGTYYINYPVVCSRKSEVRRNVAFITVFSCLALLGPVCWGGIADHWGLRASFWAAIALFVLTTGLITLRLPARPATPPD